MKLAAGMLLAALAWAADAPRIVYSKSFPGSVPAFVEIRLSRSGACEYREAADDDNPLKFTLDEPDAAEIFSLAEKLDRFKRPLESNFKVANMGIKTFRFLDGSAVTEVKFNYSVDLDAQAIANWFERIVESEQHMISLERAVRFDKLGVYKVLLALESSYDRKRLVAHSQFLPMLDRVAKNESYVHMARERAAALAEAFRGLKAKSE